MPNIYFFLTIISQYYNTVQNRWVALNPLHFLSSFVPLKGFQILFRLPALPAE